MSKQTVGRMRNRLRVVQWAAWVDLILLVALLTSSLTGQRDFVHVLGPLHGINFLLLVVIVGTAALDGFWHWWFPLLVFFTGGAPGALIGEWIIKRRLRVQAGTIDSARPSAPVGIESGRLETQPGTDMASTSSELTHRAGDERKERA